MERIDTTEQAIRTEGLTRHFTRHGTTVEAVRGLDLEVGRPQGTYFVMTRCAEDDTAYVRRLIAERGVAALIMISMIRELFSSTTPCAIHVP